VIEENVQALKRRIQEACQRSGRDPSEIQIVAVSKTVNAPKITEAARCGLKDFGENRLQEGEEKIQTLKDLDLRWHFVGRIQTNKIKNIFTTFDIIQSVDRLKVIDKANECLQEMGLTKEVLLQVNISDAMTQAGFSYHGLEAFFSEKLYEKYPALKITGLMGIGPFTEDDRLIRQAFQSFKACFEALQKSHPDLRILSMGMSHDFELAIEAGSNMIRVGTVIFGERDSKK